MGLVVQKFGGTSVRDAERVFNVAKIVTDTYAKGNDVVVVVSAQGDFTDVLVEKAREINEKPSMREMDMLLTSGEQISISLLAMAIEKLGFPVVSLTGWQAGFLTDRSHSSARIRRIETERLVAEIEKKRIVVVAGFQGINRNDDITTLGRGGSDTSAVAIAAALSADLCQIYTDVDGVYTTDPRMYNKAQKLDEITFDQMLELSTLGAQVLQNRSVEMAKRYGIPLEVRSSLHSEVPGTIVKEVVKMEKMLIKGVAKDDNCVRITLKDVDNTPGIAFRIFSALANKKANVDIIVQTAARGGHIDISFTVTHEAEKAATEVLENLLPTLGSEASIQSDDTLSKVSIVGAGMQSNTGVAAAMFEALSDFGINIQTISTSEIKISVLVDRKFAEKAVMALHDKFIG